MVVIAESKAALVDTALTAVEIVTCDSCAAAIDFGTQVHAIFKENRGIIRFTYTRLAMQPAF